MKINTNLKYYTAGTEINNSDVTKPFLQQFVRILRTLDGLWEMAWMRAAGAGRTCVCLCRRWMGGRALLILC